MRIIRFEDQSGNVQLGSQQQDGSVTLVEGCLLGDFHDTGQAAEVGKLLSPIAPTDILCIGLNYRKHAEEGKQAIPEYPVLFMKTSSAVQNPGDPIVLPRQLASDAVDYECELAVVIGRDCHNVSKDEALDYVLGYTCANDVSARDWQLQKTIDILKQYRSEKTPVLLARQMGRTGETFNTYELGRFPFDKVDMLTILIIGNNQSLYRDGYFFTPRGYSIS